MGEGAFTENPITLEITYTPWFFTTLLCEAKNIHLQGTLSNRVATASNINTRITNTDMTASIKSIKCGK